MKEIFGEQNHGEEFDYVSICIASADRVRSWSSGEVKNPETINYRTFKPEKGGLFCERIFGPTRDWECACGKYKRIKHKGVVCDRCGVEVTLSRVRRERMGHIELAVPVTHIWFYKCMPSRIGLMLDMTARSLERVIYYEDYMVIDPGSTPLLRGQLLTEVDLREAEEQFGADAFQVGMGAQAIRDIFAQINLADQIKELEEAMTKTRSKQTRKKLAKRLKLCQGFASSHSRPEAMILEVLPVIPPDLRPLVPLEGGRFATSDLNDLYRRVINRNNRLKNLLQLRTPDVIIRNEKRMLQEAVDALFDNGRHGRPVTGAGNRPLKSMSDMLKGKSGRFRQNLLGKRVDYSGRSVIVIGPDLGLHQCGLPKKMALVLFEPFIIRRLKEMGLVHTVRSAKKMIERRTPEVWDILDEVTKGHPVLLNRAPTLHRLSIQAFEPKLIEGEAIRVHPLVCTAYNADFDGDQMAVHVPLSIEAQMEARLLMLAPNNLFSPASGRPVMNPGQDIPLGCYFLTYLREFPSADAKKSDVPERLPLFNDASEVEFAIAEGALTVNDKIRFRNPDYNLAQRPFGDPSKFVIETTAGRVRFNEIWPEGLGFINTTVGKKQLSNIIWRCFQTVGQRETVEGLDRLKQLGFREATRSGCSIGITDMVIPKAKAAGLENAYKQIEEIEKQYRRGIITHGERYQKIIDIWTQVGEQVADELFRTLEYNDGKKEHNPLYVMVNSGARGNRTQIKQLAGMRGLMAKPSGEIIERPITSNFREGLSVLEYFISTHGARKGLADTALKTADSGYMTRKLVDVSQDVIVTEKCVPSTASARLHLSGRRGNRRSQDAHLWPHKLRDHPRPRGQEHRHQGGPACHREGGKPPDEDRRPAQDSLRPHLRKQAGCCAKCYGLHLATHRSAKIGEAVGIVAAQSIGEPGTQLTMRTFHVGGAAMSSFKQPFINTKNAGTLKFTEMRNVQTIEGTWIALTKNGVLSIHDDAGRELESHKLVVGAVIAKPEGAHVKKGEQIVTWDPYNVPIITEKAGKLEFRDMISGITITKEVNQSTGNEETVVIEHKEDLHPQVVIVDPKTHEVVASYTIPAGAHLNVKNNQKVEAGTTIAKTPRKASKTKDITGGLPRVAELFEARKPKDSCEIARIDGIVEIGGLVRGKRRVIVTDQKTGQQEEHLIPRQKHILVFNGDFIGKGDQITDGPVVPHDLLEILGPQALREHLVNEVQEVYRAQGVEINDKHVEIIIRQMLRKVKVTDPGDTEFLWGDQIDRGTFDKENARVSEEGGKPAEAEPVLLGITKASIETESFISAASFQDTTRVLTEASTLAKSDLLRGFKENVIMGHLIPAGTGFLTNRNFDINETEKPQLPAVEEEEAVA
ncbi:MAG: DNA-directed RNA polymerase subunit beta' [Prosthecobacter sp.]